jgi:phenylpropionate dioxygenase-like ring-hydroxylating dioxygenase large terminal subunit
MAEGGWTAIGLSNDWEPGVVAGVLVEGREWALWRGVSGSAHLWEDRCPHRGMRMSLGFVRGDRLGCLYHGWQYDLGGRCRYIPAHPELDPPETIRIAARPLAESGGLIWAAFGDPPAAEPDFAPAAPVRSLYLDAPLAAAMQAVEAAVAPGVRDARLVEIDGDTLLVAGHCVDADHCALHIARLGPVERLAERQRRAARWAEALRRAVEAGR